MQQIVVRAMGIKVVSTKFTRMGQKAADARPVWPLVAQVLRNAMGKNFTSQGRRGGGSWRQDSEDWLLRKARAGLDPRIGFATGALYAAVSDEKSQDSHLITTRTTMDLEIDLPYAARFDADRPFTKTTVGDRAEMRMIIRNHILSAWA